MKHNIKVTAVLKMLTVMEKGFADASEGITDEPSTFLLPLDGGWVVIASDGRSQVLEKMQIYWKTATAAEESLSLNPLPTAPELWGTMMGTGQAVTPGKHSPDKEGAKIITQHD